jgi:hypothetical protein
LPDGIKRLQMAV